MAKFTLEQLNTFVVHAKAASYVGGGTHSLPYRLGSHDLQFHEGGFSYLDSYFGGTDFIGQEVVYFQGRPVWAMNYYGHIVEPARITARQVGEIIQQSLSHMYGEGRFLGGFEYTVDNNVYRDSSEGDVASFTGLEQIVRDGIVVYRLNYHGGLIKD